MNVRLLTKTCAIAKEFTVETNTIPRIGEVFVVTGHEPPDHLVADIEHVVENGTMTTLITCRAYATADNRHLILKTEGWIHSFLDD